MNSLAALLYGISSSALLALLLGLCTGSLNPAKAWTSLLFGLAISVSTFWRSLRTAPTQNQSPTLATWLAFLLFALFALRSFLWLIFTDGDAIRVLSPNNLGDLSLHLCYIQQVAIGDSFWPENPIYSGALLTYPIGLDLFNSLLVLVGADPFRSLIWVGLLMSALSAIALWRWGGSFTLFGFLCNGGFLAFIFFAQTPIADWKITDLQAEAAWKSLPLALLVTQRGLLFALPAGLALLCSWRSRWFSNNPQAWQLPHWGQWLLYSSLPLFHVHSFLFLSLLLGFWFTVRRPLRWDLLKFVGAALLPASTLAFFVTGHFQAPSVLGWKPGWMQDDQNFFQFWLANFGLLPLLIPALLWKLWRQKDSHNAAFAVPALLIFLLCCFVKFAPWEWDNTKLMIWSYLLILPPLWSQLIVHWPPLSRSLALAGLFFSGFVSLLGGLDNSHRGFDLVQRSVLDGVTEAVRPLPPSERFAAAPNFNHPLLLAGRKLAMGYEGHVWSHGYDWVQRKDDLSQLLNGSPHWRALASKLNVRFIFWSPLEQEAFPASLQPWRKEAARCAAGSWGEIFDLSRPPDSSSLPRQIEPAILFE